MYRQTNNVLHFKKQEHACVKCMPKICTYFGSSKFVLWCRRQLDDISWRKDYRF